MEIVNWNEPEDAGARSKSLLDERRKAERRRVSETTAEQRAGRGLLGKKTFGSVTITDLSEEGARLIGSPNPDLRIGSTIEIKLANSVGRVIVRNIAPDPLDSDQMIYGVEVDPSSTKLRTAIRARLDADETTMEWIWAHTDETDRLIQRAANQPKQNPFR